MYDSPEVLNSPTVSLRDRHHVSPIPAYLASSRYVLWMHIRCAVFLIGLMMLVDDSGKKREKGKNEKCSV